MIDKKTNIGCEHCEYAELDFYFLPYYSHPFPFLTGRCLYNWDIEMCNNGDVKMIHGSCKEFNKNFTCPNFKQRQP